MRVLVTEDFLLSMVRYAPLVSSIVPDLVSMAYGLGALFISLCLKIIIVETNSCISGD